MVSSYNSGEFDGLSSQCCMTTEFIAVLDQEKTSVVLFSFDGNVLSEHSVEEHFHQLYKFPGGVFATTSSKKSVEILEISIDFVEF